MKLIINNTVGELIQRDITDQNPFPALSTGILGFPKDRCAIIMFSTTLAFLDGPTGLEKVVFCLHDKVTLRIFERVLQSLVQRR
jgi:O-acetyl-ADP-ribose deacetylase (regulator of RNase III)